jgi:hypothetical protein
MIYLTETLKGRAIFQGVGILILMCSVSCLVALFGINLAVQNIINWRLLFLVGISIFILSRYARTSLIASPNRLNGFDKKTSKPIDKKRAIAAFSMELVQPIALFISIVGVNNILRNTYGYTELEIIHRNSTTVCYHMGYVLCAIFAVGYVNPYKLGMYRFLAGFLLMFCSPLLVDTLDTLLWFQNLISFLLISDICTVPIVYTNISKSHRFKITTLSFAISRAFIMIITSYGLIYAQPVLGKYTFIVFSMPCLISYYIAFRYFKSLDDLNPNGILKTFSK